MIFFITEIVCMPTGTSSALRKKTSKESQYIVSCLEPGSDPPFGSDQESGCDIHCYIPESGQGATQRRRVLRRCIPGRYATKLYVATQ